MMGAMDARNMYSNLAVNKYLYAVASRWISSTYNYDDRNMGDEMDGHTACTGG